MLTGYLESASHSSSNPSSIAILGLELEVSDTGRNALSGYSVGDRVTVVLDSDGEVTGAYSPSEIQADQIGVLDSATSSQASITLTSGLEISGKPYSSGITSLVGTLVRVTSTGIGQISVSQISSSSSFSQDLNVSARTLGARSLADNVKIYDQVGNSPVAQVDLEDLKVDIIPSGQIGYSHTNSAGEVDIILLRDATGNCYTYGQIVRGSVTSGSGSDSYTNSTIAIINSAGTTSSYLYGLSASGYGGLAVNASGTVAGVVTLTRVDGVTRSDFEGEDYVSADGALIPISDEVEVYNITTKQWTTLSEAKAFSDSFTIYYDRTTTTGGQVRVICAR